MNSSLDIEDLKIANYSNNDNYNSVPLLKEIHDVLLVALVICVMFAMGCSITTDQVWSHIKKPFGILIGALSQFVLLPFCAYGLIVVLGLDPLHSTGLLILACSPGGVMSNICTIFCNGDISLSVTMTAFSTIVALVMMPFNTWLYGKSLESDSIVIPYSKMSISLISISAPTIVGMLCRYKFPKFAPFISKTGSFAGIGIIVICHTLEVIIFPDMFSGVPVVLYFAEFILPMAGLILGYTAASICGLSYRIRRTIAIEASLQNVGTALTVVTLSFPYEQLRKVWLFPFLYAFTSLIVCLTVTAIYRGYKVFYKKELIGKSICKSSSHTHQSIGVSIEKKEEVCEELLGVL